MKSKEENPKGLHQRYNITHADGTAVDSRAEYFVLRIDKRGRDKAHIAACRYAAEAYARYVNTRAGCEHLKQTGDELQALLDNR